MMRLNSYQGKRLLALARGADYAHAGETEAIDLVWSGLPKSRTQKCTRCGMWTRRNLRLTCTTRGGGESPELTSRRNQSSEPDAEA
jgi:hypothetical protein